MVKDLLTKVPFTRIEAAYNQGVVTNNLKEAFEPMDEPSYLVLTQADFLREYEPSGHKINSPLWYKNLIKYDETKKQFFEQQVFRVAIPFQKLIVAQHLVHLCGNDIHHELTNGKVDKSQDEYFRLFQKGWLDKQMEIAFYDLAKSSKVTGDGAVVLFLLDGKVRYKTLSYLNGDRLYPKLNSLTGDLEMFSRQYYDYDEEGKAVTSWVEVWDSEYMYRYKQSVRSKASKMVNLIKGAFGIEGYELVSQERHNCPEVPVVYFRAKEGACWSAVQDLIDKYEIAVSQLCQNNCAYAFPIMLLKGDNIEVQGDIYGAVKAVSVNSDGDAGFLNRPDASSSFDLQLQILLKNIFMGSFTVLPPEVKSGDLPGVAIKLIYSPSVDIATLDCKEYYSAICKLSRVFKFFYGVEIGMTSQFETMNILSWAEPYVHQNTAELISNLVQSVGVGILSKQTASENTGYGKNDEWDRLILEAKEEERANRLFDNVNKADEIINEDKEVIEDEAD